MVHPLAVSFVKLIGYPFLFLMLAGGAWAVLSMWPRFRTLQAGMRIGGIAAAVLLAWVVLPGRGPDEAVASDAPKPQAAHPMPQAPSAALVLKGNPTTRPLPASIMDVGGRSFLVAELPKPATKPAVRKTSGGSSATTMPARGTVQVLGSLYSDDANGYSIRFPAGWSIKTFNNAGGWIIDATDGRDALISVGFSPFPKTVLAEHIKLPQMAENIKAQPNTTLHAQGYGSVDGRRGVWTHSTAPLPMTTGNVMMTRVHYLVPLQDGRALELRLAARPDKYEQYLDVMKQCAATMRVTPKTEFNK